MALLPGFGEQIIPARVRLGVAVAFAMVVWPMLAPDLAATDPARPLLLMLIIEASIGLMLGLAIRLMVLALQLAGSIAAQSTALAQIFGAGVTPDPMPAIGNILMLAGITLAVASGLHVKAALAMARSYEILPDGPAGAGRRRRRLGHRAGRPGLRARLLAGGALRDRRLRLQPRARRHQPRHAAADGRLHRRPGDHRRRPPDPDARRAGDPALLGRAARTSRSPTPSACPGERGRRQRRRKGLRPDAAASSPRPGARATSRAPPTSPPPPPTLRCSPSLPPPAPSPCRQAASVLMIFISQPDRLAGRILGPGGPRLSGAILTEALAALSPIFLVPIGRRAGQPLRPAGHHLLRRQNPAQALHGISPRATPSASSALPAWSVSPRPP